MPATCGSIMAPAAAGSMPSTSWKYSGRNTVEPSIANAIMPPTADAAREDRVAEQPQADQRLRRAGLLAPEEQPEQDHDVSSERDR